MTFFDIDTLMEDARQQTGLQNFGPDDFMEGFSILVKSINEENVITSNRIDDVRHYFSRLLCNRLWFSEDLARHPEILDQDIGSPVVITSPPRTGSTKLQRILGASGNFQTVPLWKGHMFSRIPGLDNGGMEQRITQTQRYEKWMYETSPKILTSHAEFTHQPAEDNVLCEFSFRHTHIFGLFDSPAYCNWVMAADMQPMYDYFHMQIQYLQWQSKSEVSKPWVFKTPCHFGNEKHLCATFNSPRFLVTHRDPVKWMPSVTPTSVAYRKLYSDRDSTSSFSADGTAFFSRSTLDHLLWRRENPDVQVMDIPFREVNNHGVDVVRKIHEFLNLEFTPEASQNIKHWENKNHRHRHGKHLYSAEAMGTDDDAIKEVFKAYSDRFSHYF
ncbi:MAG: hypothetical protein ACI9FD_000888 [Gammaproteobacteria bacterium]|jgi:hypothetical protein